MAELDATEGVGISHELRTCNELRLFLHLTLYLSLFHLGSLFELLHTRLRGEALLIDTVDGIAHIMIILRHQYRILRYKREERHLIVDRHQLWYDLNLIPLFFRQLILHLKSTDTVNLLAEEIDTIGIFATERIDIEDRTTQGELTRFIDIIDLTETKLA